MDSDVDADMDIDAVNDMDYIDDVSSDVAYLYKVLVTHVLKYVWVKIHRCVGVWYSHVMDFNTL